MGDVPDDGFIPRDDLDDIPSRGNIIIRFNYLVLSADDRILLQDEAPQEVEAHRWIPETMKASEFALQLRKEPSATRRAVLTQ